MRKIIMVEQLKFCIFCFRPNTEIRLTKEHIIPQNIGGNLFIEEVCEDCNSKFGKEIDIQILKYHEILDALEYLNIPHNKSGILKHHFNIVLKTDDFEAPAVFNDGNFRMIPTKLPDGSIIVPEEINENILTKVVKRDPRIKSSKLPLEFIINKIKQLKDKYDKAKPGETIQEPSIGRALKKRRDKVKIIVTPKGPYEIERLIAKIYYEFLYFLEGRFIFHSAKELQPIFDLIDKGKSSNYFHISRVKPKFESPIPTHLIRLIFEDTYQELYVSFFGILDFQFFTFFHYSNFWDDIKKRFKLNNIVGIHFEQSVKTGRKNFWFVSNKGNFITPNA